MVVNTWAQLNTGERERVEDPEITVGAQDNPWEAAAWHQCQHHMKQSLNQTSVPIPD